MDFYNTLIHELTNMRWSDYVDILIVAILIYRLLPLLRSAGTVKIVRAVIALFVVLGITDVFGALSADFSSGLDTDIPVWVGSVEQAARVAIDEEGAEAASYTLIVAPGAAEPTQREVIDFVLDRPFLFIIEISNLPLFAGVVNEP